MFENNEIRKANLEISKLLEGTYAKDAIRILQGNTCGPRNTSCADQLTKALSQALGE